MVHRILVIDDDPDMGRVLKMTLEMAGYKVVTALSGEEGLKQAKRRLPDLVLLDIAMPGINGWEVCRRLREMTDVPILMLTILNKEEEIVKGLELGADDFVVKPWSNRELVVRIRTILRRVSTTRARKGWEEVCSHGDLLIDIAHRNVLKNGRCIDLTPIEFRLLTYLARRPGVVVSNFELMAQVWGIEAEDDFGSLRWHIYNLRQKIEDDPQSPRYILTKHGVGYSFADLGDGE